MDYSSIVVGVLALFGTLAGSYFSNNKNQALIAYRLQQLEDKVNKHNHVIERMADIEKKQSITEEKLKVANNRIADLEKSL